jgi:hypothetical protein
VSVVVVLGNELVLAIRSEGGSCASGEAACVMMAGIVAVISVSLWGVAYGDIPLPQRAARATAGLVVVAGVSEGGSDTGVVARSTVPEP